MSTTAQHARRTVMAGSGAADRGWAWWVATLGGLGGAPIAPGTLGSLAGVGAAWLLDRWLLPPSGLDRAAAAALAVALVAAVGVVSSSIAAARLGLHDPSAIVVDELCGMLAVALAAPLTAPAIVAGFLLFRLFDILKPPPISWIERRLPSGWGIMADDLAAALPAALGVHALLWALPGAVP